VKQRRAVQDKFLKEKGKDQEFQIRTKLYFNEEEGLENEFEEDLNAVTCKAMIDGIMVGRTTTPPSFIKSVTYSEDERGQGSSSQPSTSGTRQIPRIKTPKPKRKCPNPKGEANLLMFR